jgi:hypothetical protein
MDYRLIAIDESGCSLNVMDFGYWVSLAEATETLHETCPEAIAILKAPDMDVVWQNKHFLVRAL